MFWTARGGVAGWSSICGTIPPAQAAIGLIVDTDVQMEMVNNLMGWFRKHPFPEYQPNMELPQVSSDSSLCHVQVTNWAHETGFDVGGPERSERCGGASADVARFVAQMLNDYADGVFEVTHEPSEVVGECMTCHSELTRGRESCTTCHKPPIEPTDIHDDFY